MVTARHRRLFWIFAVASFLVVATGCSSTESVELIDDSLPDTPLTIPSSDDPTTTTPTPSTTDPTQLTTVPDTAPPGTVYNTASVGAPMLVFDQGVAALDTDGKLTPIANGAVTAGSDLAGGIVFQIAAGADASDDTSIYWLPAGATEASAAIPESGDSITLQGVTTIGGAATAIYIRHSDPPVLERAPVAGGAATVLTNLAGGSASVDSVHVVGPYITAAWASPDGNQGWVLFNAANGDRIGGTRIDGADPCSNDGNCPELVTISADGANIYRLVPAGDSLRLLVTQSANGLRVADIDLDRAAGSWYPEQLSVQGDAVIISRTQQDDPFSKTLPALVVNIASGDIFQLTETGLVRPIG